MKLKHILSESVIEWQVGTPKKSGQYLVLHLDHKGEKSSTPIYGAITALGRVGGTILLLGVQCRILKFSQVMQVFIVGSPLETAQCMDKLRLNKQILECRQILDALNGAKAWSNHPCVLQYRGYEQWLRYYKRSLVQYVRGRKSLASHFSVLADAIRPDWHDQRYYDNMKARLYTKDKEHYKQFAEYGTSDYNLYYVDGEWRKYVNGKRIE